MTAHHVAIGVRREAARVRHREGHHDDLWRGLLVTFDAMAVLPATLDSVVPAAARRSSPMPRSSGCTSCRQGSSLSSSVGS